MKRKHTPVLFRSPFFSFYVSLSRDLSWSFQVGPTPRPWLSLSLCLFRQLRSFDRGSFTRPWGNFPLNFGSTVKQNPRHQSTSEKKQSYLNNTFRGTLKTVLSLIFITSLSLYLFIYKKPRIIYTAPSVIGPMAHLSLDRQWALTKLAEALFGYSTVDVTKERKRRGGNKSARRR